MVSSLLILLMIFWWRFFVRFALIASSVAVRCRSSSWWIFAMAKGSLVRSASGSLWNSVRVSCVDLLMGSLVLVVCAVLEMSCSRCMMFMRFGLIWSL